MAENSNPLITIITPLHNAEIYIYETIESVINQTYKNWEMIIVDDCSTDSSRDIVKEFENKDTRIKLIELEFNFGGPARPRNVGIENAKGEYVAFLDADDVWFPKKLEKQMDFLKQNQDIDICHTLSNIIDENSVEKGVLNSRGIYNMLKFLVKEKNLLFYTNYININSTLMKIDKALKFEEGKNLIAAEDWKYWIDNNKAGKNIKLVNEVLVKYRVHDASISNRESDIGYRRAIYILSKMFLKNQIQMRHYIFSCLPRLFIIWINSLRPSRSTKSRR
jgi:teichuronic acid biosynthesis glycosyltransferase TuaG